jgi:tetratricopeptide (TPR) repeat protein
VLAKVGLEREAREAIQEARAIFPANAPQDSRRFLGNFTALALLELGAVDEAIKLASARPGYPVWVGVVQGLVDRGELDRARAFISGSEDPLVMTVVASALASRGRSDEAKALTLAALATLERAPIDPDERDVARVVLEQRLLLRVMTPSEAAALIRKRDSADELASFAVALARVGHADLARQIALDAAARIDALREQDGQGRIRVKIAEALSRSGDAARALSTARSIKEPNRQAVALAQAAYGFASEGGEEQGRALIGEVGEILKTIENRDQQSLIWAMKGMASIRLGDYVDAMESGQLLPNPDDHLAVYTAIIRDDALRRNGALRELFVRGPSEGLGRFELHWP